VTALESKSSALATPSDLDQSRPNLKVWTPTRLNLISRYHAPRGNAAWTLRVQWPERTTAGKSLRGSTGRGASPLHYHAERGNEVNIASWKNFSVLVLRPRIEGSVMRCTLPSPRAILRNFRSVR